MNELFKRPERREIHDLNIVPIIDMFIIIIFFLLLSTAFLAFNKLTVPPAKVSVQTDPVKPPPVAPKLFMSEEGAKIQVLLRWSGESPGERTIWIDHNPKNFGKKASSESFEPLRSMLKEFAGRFPLEKSLQIGLARKSSYQSLIALMDEVLPIIPDLVLISYEEAETRLGAKEQP